MHSSKIDSHDNTHLSKKQHITCHWGTQWKSETKWKEERGGRYVLCILKLKPTDIKSTKHWHNQQDTKKENVSTIFSVQQKLMPIIGSYKSHSFCLPNVYCTPIAYLMLTKIYHMKVTNKSDAEMTWCIWSLKNGYKGISTLI